LHRVNRTFTALEPSLREVPEILRELPNPLRTLPETLRVCH